MANNIDGEILVDINGASFAHNAAGELYTLIEKHVVPVALDFKGVADAETGFFMVNLNGNFEQNNIRPKMNFTGEEMKTFMADQMIWLQHLVPEADRIANFEQAHEVALIRMLGYQEHLISPAWQGVNLHVRFAECYASDPATAGSRMHQIRTHATYNDMRQRVADWVVTNRSKVSGLVSQFTNIVCMIAYLFRAKGHHYLATYEGDYNRLWDKVKGEVGNPNATWAQLATIASHAIPPIVLDKFWMLPKHTDN